MSSDKNALDHAGPEEAAGSPPPSQRLLLVAIAVLAILVLMQGAALVSVGVRQARLERLVLQGQAVQGAGGASFGVDAEGGLDAERSRPPTRTQRAERGCDLRREARKQQEVMARLDLFVAQHALGAAQASDLSALFEASMAAASASLEAAEATDCDAEALKTRQREQRLLLRSGAVDLLGAELGQTLDSEVLRSDKRTGKPPH